MIDWDKLLEKLMLQKKIEHMMAQILSEQAASRRLLETLRRRARRNDRGRKINEQQTNQFPRLTPPKL